MDRVWVYGNVEDYIIKMTNVGRRADDYNNNTKNCWSGNYWWDCKKEIHDFGDITRNFSSGKIEPLNFKVNEAYVTTLSPTNDGKYLDVVVKFCLKIV